MPSTALAWDATKMAETPTPVSNGVYWGEQGGAIRLKVGLTTTTLPSTMGLVPTSISTNGYTAGAAQAWTQCGSETCRLHFDFPVWRSSMAIGDNALAVTVTSSGNVFWGDSMGVHRQVFSSAFRSRSSRRGHTFSHPKEFR